MILVAALVGVVALVIALTGGDGSDPRSAAAETTAAPSSESPAPAAPTSSAAAAPGQTPASGVPTSSPSLTAPVPVPVGGFCPDENIAVYLQMDPTVRVGDEPKFTVVTTNVGLTNCTRDVGKRMQQVVVSTLDGKRLWSNFDCAKEEGEAFQQLQPSERVTFEITWGGKTSAPGACTPEERKSVGPGDYFAYAQVGTKRGPNVPFAIKAVGAV